VRRLCGKGESVKRAEIKRKDKGESNLKGKFLKKGEKNGKKGTCEVIIGILKRGERGKYIFWIAEGRK
jgi:hypothetical protein